MKIISFAWTTQALLDGHKIVTRRDWKDQYARQFKAGDLVRAYNRSPRFGGTAVAIVRLTCDPYKESLCKMTKAELEAEGGYWDSVEDFMPGEPRDKEYWVIRFELVEALE